MEIESPPESIYKLLQFMDRGALKWLSDPIMHVILLMENFQIHLTTTSTFPKHIEGPSKQHVSYIDIKLRALEDDESDCWRKYARIVIQLVGIN